MATYSWIVLISVRLRHLWVNVTQTIKFNAALDEDRALGSRPGRRAATNPAHGKRCWVCCGAVGLTSSDSQLIYRKCDVLQTSFCGKRKKFMILQRLPSVSKCTECKIKSAHFSGIILVVLQLIKPIAAVCWINRRYKAEVRHQREHTSHTWCTWVIL